MATFGPEQDHQLRTAAFIFLDSLGDYPVVTQEDLQSFSFMGLPFRLMPTQQGIWKPKQLDTALSIRTVYSPDPARRPYADEIGPDGFLRYKWRGHDPQQFENRALREALRRDLPLIWFQGVAPSTYVPIYPVYLAAEEPEWQQFVVALNPETLSLRRDLLDREPEVVRRYAEAAVQVRLHQRVFRERVLIAYGNSVRRLPSSSPGAPRCCPCDR